VLPLLEDAPIDLARMQRQRFAKLGASMASSGVDAVVAIGLPNVRYATGLEARLCDSARAHYERSIAVVFAGDAAAHLFTSQREGIPADHPESHSHPPLHLEFEEGVDALADFLRKHLGADGGRVAIDESTAAMHVRLGDALDHTLSRWELADGARVFGAARLCKTTDEVLCIRRAQAINEAAMRDVLADLQPGVRQCELTAQFLRRIHELGASANEIDPIWQIMAPRLAENPWSTRGDLPFPRTSTDRFLREGDVVWVDTGITVHGYASDFGRTWICARAPQPSPEQRDAFERWRAVVARVVESVRPGVSGLDLVNVAKRGEPRTPWMSHFYLAHGVGLNSAEMPLIGTDMGEAFDAEIELRPGMILVLEPAIWSDGHAGYRSEEIVAVTEEGCVFLSHFPYTPYAPAEGDAP